MKVRAMETVTIAWGEEPTIEGWTLSDWKKILLTGIKRCVHIGRNTYDWDAHERETQYSKAWVKVGPYPEHEVDESAVKFHTYKHGGETNLQAIYFFETEEPS